mgnify:FL=1
MDENIVQKIIELEESLGWNLSLPENKRWSDFLKREIQVLREQMEKALAQGSVPRFNTASRDGMIHGVGGHDRFVVREDGEVVFLVTFCDYINKTQATNRAISSGWTII